MKIAIAADHGGYKLKEEIKPYIESLGHTVTDFGTYSEDSVITPPPAQGQWFRERWTGA